MWQNSLETLENPWYEGKLNTEVCGKFRERPFCLRVEGFGINNFSDQSDDDNLL
jgi:hypothetical protein